MSPSRTTFAISNTIYCVGLSRFSQNLLTMLGSVWCYFFRPTNRWEKYLLARSSPGRLTA